MNPARDADRIANLISGVEFFMVAGSQREYSYHAWIIELTRRAVAAIDRGVLARENLPTQADRLATKLVNRRTRRSKEETELSKIASYRAGGDTT